MKFIDRTLDSTTNLVSVRNTGKFKLQGTTQKKRGGYNPLFLLYLSKNIFFSQQ